MGLTITEDDLEQRYFSYKKIQMDQYGWASADGPKPRNYDLVTLKVKSIYGDKNVSGWWDGEKWVGLRLASNHKVVKWQRKELK